MQPKVRTKLVDLFKLQPFQVVVWKSLGGFSLSVNKGYIHTCGLRSLPDSYFVKDITKESFPIRNTEESIKVYGVATINPSTGELENFEIQVTNDDPGMSESIRSILIAEINITDNTFDIRQIVGSDIWFTELPSDGGDDGDSSSDDDSSSDEDSSSDDSLEDSSDYEEPPEDSSDDGDSDYPSDEDSDDGTSDDPEDSSS